MTDHRYRRPPITEAVIEIRFAEPVEMMEIEKINGTLGDRYPRSEVLSNIDLRLDGPTTDGSPKVSARSEFSSFKRTSEDALEIVIVGQTQFLVSRLAPYPGWEEFLAQFKREWRVWKARAGYKKIERIGVRYINRLDFPVQDGLVHEDRYLNVRVIGPAILGNFLAAACQAKFDVRDLGCHVIINSGTVESPIPNNISFMLDIDVVTVDSGNVAQKDEEMFEHLERVRLKKNLVFEASITQAARDLFNT